MAVNLSLLSAVTMPGIIVGSLEGAAPQLGANTLTVGSANLTRILGNHRGTGSSPIGTGVDL